MSNKVDKVVENFNEQIKKVSSSALLEQLRVAFLGKKGEIAALMGTLKDLGADERKAFGAKVNIAKVEIEKKIEQLSDEIKNKQIEDSINSAPKYDVSLPVNSVVGSLHPITIVQKEIEDIFKSMGFIIEDGNEIETEYNNFEAVNIPADHPARDMTDTYYLENGQVLKTHTSASQNRIMKKHGPALRVLFPGRCFRNEAMDASHENTFFQLEGMMIDENISISNLIYFMKTLLSKIFNTNVNIRLRPGYFPFVEPGFELEMSCLICHGDGCSTCKGSGWIELLGCGMIHPAVLEMGGIDSEKYTGFAFGMGLTRLAMMKYNINDIRVLNSGDLRVLKQFGVM